MEQLIETIKLSVILSGTLWPVIISVVKYVGKFGVSGNWSLVVSLLTGALLSAGAQLAYNPVPTNFGGWFTFTITALIPGLVASGVYDVGKELAEKGAAAVK